MTTAASVSTTVPTSAGPAGPNTVFLDPTKVWGPPAKLSVCLIVKNEELSIEKVLTSVKAVADELVVVDTGSTDRTVELATAAGAKVSHFTWCDDFSAARNAAFAQCTLDWIMWIDADDVLTPASAKRINYYKSTLMTKPELRTIFCPYHYEYDENGNVAVNLNRERIVKNGIGHKWIGKIHETLGDPWPYSVRVEDVIIEHRTHKDLVDRKKGRNLRIFEQYIDIEKDTLRELFLYGSELQQVARHDDAERVLLKYLERMGDAVDMVGEKYSVYMKLADIYYQTKQTQKCVDVCYKGIRLDPSRAECATILGVQYMINNFVAVGFAWFVYACLCTQPPANTSLVVQKLYWDVPMHMVAQIFDKMDASTMAKRLSQAASLVNKISADAIKRKRKEKRA